MSAYARPRAAARAPPRVRAPRPLLAPEAERALSDRQREILDALEALAVQDGFAELTMAQLAARVNCSLRTLYGLAPRKDALLLTVVDRRLHRIGRAAMAPRSSRAWTRSTALRAYLEAATIAVRPTTEAFARELADRAGRRAAHRCARRLRHRRDRAPARARGRPRARSRRSTRARSRSCWAASARFFARPSVLPAPPGVAQGDADAIVAIVLRGLVRE